MDNFGIYKILNKKTNKKYIGSTSESFRKRFNLHKYHLRNNKHKNSHLQYSWNKYGEEEFSFNIVEVCTDRKSVLDREQYYIDIEDFENLYNINPFATGGLQFSQEIIDERSKTIVKINKDRSERYKMWKIGFLLNENLSEKEIELFNKWLNRKPWNKNKKYESTDHLKVPKQKKGDRTKDIETKRNNLPEIDIYENGNFIKSFRSAKDIEEYSMRNDCILNVNSRFKGENRMGTPSKKLRSFNINQSCKTGKPYKGLTFKYKVKTAPLIGDDGCEASKNGRC